MKRVLALVLALAVAVAVALAAGRTDRAAAKPEAGSLVGTGSTFVFPLVSKWIPAIDQAYGTRVTYTGTGSGTGIAQITARAVDFGASDAPLSPDQLAACKGCLVIPWALAAMSVPYNVPGVDGRIRLSGPVLANIYLGRITTWNNAAIKALNPKLNLPGTKITPVYRADSSGSTYAFTEYLSAVSPQWKSKVGFNTAVNFPAGVGARGSSGVSGIVKSTAGALTYVDAAYATTNKLTFATIKNRSGKFATPGLRGIKAAVSTLPKKITSVSQLEIVNPPKAAGKLAYPIATFTYVIVASNSGSKAADLRKFIYWDVTQGQKFGPPLWFQPLPVPVQAFAFRELKKIQAGT
ncbi:MAG TPA: phosphate ABC transporter substrate-binding protein PstS [Gaiellaceae bacterium]|nr:phosphate ABC transporter substrate-binding protein PstS [Gaiellaceae bacterium]